MSGYFIPKGFFIQQFLEITKRPFNDQKEYIESLNFKTRTYLQLASFQAFFRMTTKIKCFEYREETIFDIEEAMRRIAIQQRITSTTENIKAMKIHKGQLVTQTKKQQLKKMKPFCLRCTLTKKASLYLILFSLAIQAGVIYSLKDTQGPLFASNAVAGLILGAAFLTIIGARGKGYNTHDKHVQ